MSKVKIEKLENIVLEGGGAKGAAYAGAIMAIEDELKGHCANNSTSYNVGTKNAILDFWVKESKYEGPQVRRFAGASAGAITSFALALGLNSEMIVGATKYPFTNFLKDLDIGKYRMVSSDGTISVGEDKRKLLGQGDGNQEYTYQLDRKHKVKESPVKKQLRSYLLNIAKRMLFAGAIQFMTEFKKIYDFIANIFNKDESGGGTDFEPDKWGVFSMMFKKAYNLLETVGIVKTKTPMPLNPLGALPSSDTPTKFSPQFEVIANKVMDELVDLAFWDLKESSGMNLSLDAVGNVIWDRGLFSGFAVREFFYDLMIFACVNDTHFQRCYFPKAEDRTALRAIDMNMENGRLKADFSGLSPKIQEELERLPQITFEEFYAKTGISLTLCVSNFSTDEPVYFSEKTTPIFPVVEAVGASMSIPPAIKPVYNAADVWPYANGEPTLYDVKPDSIGKKPQKKGAYFNQMQYELDQLAIKKFLAKKFGWAANSNSPMSFTGHLLMLHRFLQNNREDTTFGTWVDCDGLAVRITYDHLVFHYNAAFKGLLLDGGYRCNIPYNIFRNSIFNDDPQKNDLDPMFEKTLAIKLDNPFPFSWVARIYDQFKEFPDELKMKKFFRKKKKHFFGGILKRRIQFIFSGKKEPKPIEGEDVFEIDDFHTLNIASFDKIAEHVIEVYQKQTKRDLKPWNRQKSVFAFAGEGYNYGANQGQARYMSDHEHIIPLYSYAIGTYDFDLKSIEPLVNLANRKSYRAVNYYFNATGQE
jgi:predicted acylesterase/phospholipase RssA